MVTNVVLFSAIYGGYDEPKPLPAGLDAPAIMLTDRPETAHLASAAGWHAFVVPHGIATTKGDPARLAPMLAHKWWKTHPQALNELTIEAAIGADAMAWLVEQGPARDDDGTLCRGVEVALWVDGSMTITAPDYGARCLAALGSDDVAFTPHPWRTCAIAEGEYSATLARYSNTQVAAQTEFYGRFHPRGWGLIATGAIAWRVNLMTRAFGHAWWEEQLNWSHQDQISLPVLLRLTDEHQFGPMEGVALAWNRNLPWEQWWTLANHAIAP